LDSPVARTFGNNPFRNIEVTFRTAYHRRRLIGTAIAFRLEIRTDVLTVDRTVSTE
jgi:hypothetical protein